MTTDDQNQNKPNPRIEGMRDAAAWLQATKASDTEGRNAIAMNCDPVELNDALTETILWIVRVQGIDFEHLLEQMREAAERGERRPPE
jgi:hypothetical protein